ncbi:MAG: thioredoxin [Candidatus Nealsonbacteria bacterium CG23_combo_of_CG06-09_8_20_14_all_40_13]|uniref:Thioredoxin n=1 Tax=Candidatus Nealsonbacteria bacterium CG23_combo_of_CG06-09_8_20_14_all_40_13 TaxID=1974724 RepID=A0A2G9YRP8_9BACT|nr:MAG: thioredoxin [Candidatus Nealsonbacteria bacterium CG23_combo_of_CG06-09_8_20_14_all_40_13]PIR70987.1 MAG: thioredoxin [Candidatus Nealsonbacteria bacterium CG10_big_fil_rev_8_21_14_0_10_40_24]PIU43353.1 MAG: thioredoxin [Candidatus Nealsonbacteria bacterium CG07_land_8_20_14_0_80_40_10]
MAHSLEISEQDFQKKLSQAQLPIMADFYANWCAPCQTLEPTLEDIAKKYEGKIDVVKIDIDKSPNLVTLFSIMSVPTILFFKGTKVVDQSTGLVDKEEIEKKLEKLI